VKGKAFDGRHHDTVVENPAPIPGGYGGRTARAHGPKFRLEIAYERSFVIQFIAAPPGEARGVVDDERGAPPMRRRGTQRDAEAGDRHV
jgi:hypothetical protein